MSILTLDKLNVKCPFCSNDWFFSELGDHIYKCLNGILMKFKMKPFVTPDEHYDKISALEKDNEDKIKALEKGNEDKIKAMDRDNEDKISALEKDNEDKIKALGKYYEDKIKALEKYYEDKMKTLESKHHDQIQSIEQNHRSEREVLLKNFADTNLSVDSFSKNNSRKRIKEENYSQTFMNINVKEGVIDENQVLDEDSLSDQEESQKPPQSLPENQNHRALPPYQHSPAPMIKQEIGLHFDHTPIKIDFNQPLLQNHMLPFPQPYSPYNQLYTQYPFQSIQHHQSIQHQPSLYPPQINQTKYLIEETQGNSIAEFIKFDKQKEELYLQKAKYLYLKLDKNNSVENCFFKKKHSYLTVENGFPNGLSINVINELDALTGQALSDRLIELTTIQSCHDGKHVNKSILYIGYQSMVICKHSHLSDSPNPLFLKHYFSKSLDNPNTYKREDKQKECLFKHGDKKSEKKMATSFIRVRGCNVPDAPENYKYICSFSCLISQSKCFAEGAWFSKVCQKSKNSN
ncbi:hypothetical protein CYY_007905 [Polysphondylium violaceum]|uniref:Uncharacterized protein n=1 Tax=Polysphondylium violaceum TaxID=133409 RepID=A0A8J4PNN9_9MYCE|nr:hypothetical protein CYY_007905 [Polysphondylium violaceum]